MTEFLQGIGNTIRPFHDALVFIPDGTPAIYGLNCIAYAAVAVLVGAYLFLIATSYANKEPLQ